MGIINPKPKQPSLLRQLFEGGAFVPTQGGLYTNLQKIGKQITSNVASNIDPYSYRNPVSRFISAGLGNEKSEDRTEREMYLSSAGKNENIEDKNRIDLINMWAGKPQKFNTVQKSDYKPTISDEPNAKYYKIPELEKKLFSNLVRTGVMKGKFNGPIKSKKDLEDALDISEGGYFSEIKNDSGKKIGYTGTMMSLGEGTLSIGEDEKGPYLSYYDKWDINPLYGMSSAIGSVLPKSAQRGVDKIVTGIPESMGITSAPRVYGRIYFDRKTGKPIGKDFEDIFEKLKSESNKPEQPIYEGAKSSGYTGRFSGLINKKSSNSAGNKK